MTGCIQDILPIYSAFFASGNRSNIDCAHTGISMHEKSRLVSPEHGWAVRGCAQACTRLRRLSWIHISSRKRVTFEMENIESAQDFTIAKR
jgi:hypothetical protein